MHISWVIIPNSYVAYVGIRSGGAALSLSSIYHKAYKSET